MNRILVYGILAAAVAPVPLHAADSEARQSFRNPNAQHTLQINAGRNRII